MKGILLIAIATSFLQSCAMTPIQRLSQLPKTISPDNYPQTQVVTQLTDRVDTAMNAIYSLGFDQFITFTNTKPGISLTDFKNKLQNALFLNNELQYTKIGTSPDTGYIRIETYIPVIFDPLFESLSHKITFDQVPVSTFGISPKSFRRLKHQIEIHRYQDDDNFVIGLLPKDRKQQVLLYKTDKYYPSLQNMYEGLKNELFHGRTDMTVPDRLDSYTLDPTDLVIIPRLSLGIEMEQPLDRFPKNNKNNPHGYTNKMLSRQISFLLNEAGSKILAKDEKEISEIPRGQVIGKRLTMDKPFYLIIRQRNSDLPNLVIYIRNAELMDIE